MDPDGTNQTVLTNSPEDNFAPTWSPDGSKIAFSRVLGEGARRQIYVMDADGRNETPVTDDSSFASEPAWSPDGTKIAFSGLDNNDLALRLFVALHDRCVLDLASRLLVDAFLTNAMTALRHLMEVNVLRLDRGVERDRHVLEPERDGTVPE
jgi:Tol biopolymer transport system component